MQERWAGFRRRYGPRALIAGGSHGLGMEFARQLAGRGMDLVLVAESEEPLLVRAEDLAADYQVAVRPIVADLARPEGLARVAAETDDLDVGLLVCNAAHVSIGRFLELDLEDMTRMIDVNCRAPLALAHEFGRRMVLRGGGGIMILSSLSGLHGCALMSAYGATKAFDLVLAEALWDELREHGIDVLAFCPGATRTPTYQRERPRSTPSAMEVEPVAEQALAALGKRPTSVAGAANRFTAFTMNRLLPRRLAIERLGRNTRATYSR